MSNSLSRMNISERSRKRLEQFISLGGEKVDQYGLSVELKPILLPPHGLFSGRTYFNIYFSNNRGQFSAKPVIEQALFSVGGKGVPPWIEIGYYWPEIVFKEEKKLSQTKNIAFTREERRLFKLLADFIPPGGHMMIPYDLDDNVLSQNTWAALQKNVPIVATPVGFLMFGVGFTIPFRDWYIAEGGHEGPRKLQFEKPLTEERTRAVWKRVVDELTLFIDQCPETEDAELVESCKNNARTIRNLILARLLKTEKG